MIKHLRLHKQVANNRSIRSPRFSESGVWTSLANRAQVSSRHSLNKLFQKGVFETLDQQKIRGARCLPTMTRTFFTLSHLGSSVLLENGFNYVRTYFKMYLSILASFSTRYLQYVGYELLRLHI
jgi:hypothetical protein